MAYLENSEIIIVLGVLEQALKDGFSVDFAMRRLVKIFGKKGKAEIMEEMRGRVYETGKVSSAFDGILPENFIEVIQSCDKLGRIDVIIGEIKGVYELRGLLYAKVKKAVASPLGVLGGLVCIFIGVLLFLIPYFQKVFKGVDPRKIPEVTKTLFEISNAAHGNLVIFFACLGLAGWALFELVKRNFALFFKIPLVKQIMTGQESATAFLLLAIFIEAGLNVNRVFTMVGRSLVGPLKGVLTIAAAEVESGTSIPEALGKGGLSDDYLMYVEVGELKNRLEVEFKRLSVMETERLDQRVNRLTLAMNVTLMCVAALSIVGLYAATILPMFDMAGAM